MLVMRPYSLPINPTKKAISDLLGQRGFLLGSEPWKGDSGIEITLKRWAEEEPAFEQLPGGGAFAVIRVFIHYVILDPDSDLNERSGKTVAKWEPHRRSGIATLWVPLSTNTQNSFLLSVGNVDEADVKRLMVELIPGVNTKQIEGQTFDFPKVRALTSRGWMHGCENRPGVIQRGTLYGDFEFARHSELDGFLDNPNGTESNQEGIVINDKRKVRVLRLGKFQLMGIPKEHFYDGPNRKSVMEECFGVARLLLTTRVP